MKRKIIYLIQVPFNKRDYKRFGLEIFMAEGFEVYVWDFTPFLNPNENHHVIPPDPIHYSKLYYFKNKMDAINSISRIDSNTFIINLISYNICTYGIFKAISKRNIPYIINMGNTTFNVPNKLIRRIFNIKPRKLFDYIFAKIPCHLLNIKPATLVCAGGEKSLTKSALINANSEVLFIHTMDYDIFLGEKKDDQARERHIVFLDQYVPFHPRVIALKVTPPTKPEEYYPALCKFFSHLERKFGLEVIIAAHPRSNYEKKADLFGKRQIVRGKTSELVRDAKLVLLHYSTTINFAVLYRNPMIFITIDTFEHKKDKRGHRIAKLAGYFKKVPVNVSKEINVDYEKELLIHEERYSKYKNDFIKMNGTENMPFWQVVCDRIKSFK
ncbi:hypothetical protein ACFL9T_07790 [Thermodesulfobacteriota bacterium]